MPHTGMHTSYHYYHEFTNTLSVFVHLKAKLKPAVKSFFPLLKVDNA